MSREPRGGVIAVTGVGACTPLGLTALSSYAALRAGLIAFAETTTVGREGEPLRASYLSLLPLGGKRRGRILDLAARALDDLAGSARTEARRNLAAFIALPDLADGPESDEDTFAGEMAATLKARMPGLDNRLRFFNQGRSAFFFALEAGMADLASGGCDAALVGAANSLCSTPMLKRLDAKRRLLGPSTDDGIIPGEGAAFVLLERLDAAATQGHALASIPWVGTGREPNHFQQDQPNRAEALSKILNNLRKHEAGRGRRADLLFTCETGERYWADELSLAYLRNASIMPEPFVRTMAAEGYGDLGSAAGAVQLGMAVLALARPSRTLRVAPSTALLCGSSDDGHVGACLAQAFRAA